MKFMFKFVGLEEMTEKERIEKIRTEVTNWKTLNEVRKELGLPEIEGGDIVLSPTYIQGKMVGGAPAGGMEGMEEAIEGEEKAPEEGLSEEERNDYIKRFTEQLEKETSEKEEGTGSEVNTEDIWEV